MTGPLAPLFAQVREGSALLADWAEEPLGMESVDVDNVRGRLLEALSAIERHVQDMETARALLIRLRQWDALNPLPDPIPAPFADMRYWVEEIDRTLAALPAREKGTEHLAPGVKMVDPFLAKIEHTE